MLLPKNNVKRYFLLFWFRYIFLCFSYLFFYQRFFNQLNSDSKLKFKLLNLGIGFRKVISLKYLFNKENTYFNFLNGDFYLVYLNDLNSFFDVNIKEFQLFSLSYKGFFINPFYLDKLNNFYSFYDSNYLLILNFLSLFINSYIKMIYYLKKIINLTIYKLRISC